MDNLSTNDKNQLPHDHKPIKYNSNFDALSVLLNELAPYIEEVQHHEHQFLHISLVDLEREKGKHAILHNLIDTIIEVYPVIQRGVLLEETAFSAVFRVRDQFLSEESAQIIEQITESITAATINSVFDLEEEE